VNLRHEPTNNNGEFTRSRAQAATASISARARVKASIIDFLLQTDHFRSPVL
jgi:hypothetical protein